MPRALQIHPDDNVAVALSDLKAGESVLIDGVGEVALTTPVQAKHKFALADLAEGVIVKMYGVEVGRPTERIPQGAGVTTENLVHAIGDVLPWSKVPQWAAPDVSQWSDRTFDGYLREDGRVGTANHWLVVPLVFCENRNLGVMRDALIDGLGYGQSDPYRDLVGQLVKGVESESSDDALQLLELRDNQDELNKDRTFPGVDSIQFLTHDGGCGGMPEDSATLCRLLAGYATHPNVAGVTVLSLGCQHAQVSLLTDAIKERCPEFDRPLLIFEQQKERSERDMLRKALSQTVVALRKVNENSRSPQPLSKLSLGVECGGSDGFSGISANPVIGEVSDRLAALKAQVVLSEFPELCGAEQEMVNRSRDAATAERFLGLMEAYERVAVAAGGGLHQNPSPGNVADGLITDAIKSAGAAKKGGTSPVNDVLDYTEPVRAEGLSLLCTPGNDVESTTAMAGSGCNLIAFSTGLGTPTGNPVCPVVKISSNTSLAGRLPDMIDFDTGGVIDGSATIAERADALMELMIEVASGSAETCAGKLGQSDFIPWKRGPSL